LPDRPQDRFPLLDSPYSRLIIVLMTTPSSDGTGRYTEPLNQRQVQIYRRMTGEQRLRLAFDMTSTAWRIAADAIRNGTPGISEQDVRARLRERRTWANSRQR
jgi:hypothetical protein